MKKIVLGVLLLSLAVAVFADDALVLPKGVLRVYLTGAYAFFNQEWDVDGEKVDLASIAADGVSAINLGGAAEFGVTDWISAAVQWAPGWTVWSGIDNGTPPNDKLLVTGPYNVFAGAKLQIIGPKAPVANETMRLAAATGIKIPVQYPDNDYWTEQFTAMMGGEEWHASYADKPLWGIGARGYFDYVLNEMFYLNLYSEFIYYLGTLKGNELSVPTLADSREYNLGFDLTAELEPHFVHMFDNGMQLEIGVPVTFTFAPEVKIDDTAQDNSESWLLSVSPSVQLFLTKFVLPIQFKLGYTLPLVGDNSYASNTVVLQAKAYYAKR